jgi:hypothetical protein
MSYLLGTWGLRGCDDTLSFCWETKEEQGTADYKCPNGHEKNVGSLAQKKWSITLALCYSSILPEGFSRRLLSPPMKLNS